MTDKTTKTKAAYTFEKRAFSEKKLWQISKAFLKKFDATKKEKYLELSNEAGFKALKKGLKRTGKYL